MPSTEIMETLTNFARRDVDCIGINRGTKNHKELEWKTF